MPTLHITFSGLCLFVPSKDGRQMNVLMPVTEGVSHPTHPDHPVPKHRVLIEAPGLFVSMAGWELDFSHLGGTYNPVLPLDLANISDHAGGRVPLGALNGRAVSHVRLHSGGVTHTSGLGRWEYPCKGPEMRMAHYVRWSIEGVPIGWVPLRRRKLFGGGSTEEFALLRPDDSGNTHLVIHHLPEEELTSRPARKVPGDCDPPEHFAAFHQLLPGVKPIYPGFKAEDPYGEHFPIGEGLGREDLTAVPESTLGKTFTCMAASADAE